jgi:hypothetical protein
MAKRKATHLSFRRPWLLAGGLAVIAVVYVAGAQALGWWPHLRSTGNKVGGNSPAQTTSTAPTAQSNYNGGSERPTTTNSNTAANGANNTVTDNNGSSPTTTPSSSWSKSADGSSIVVYTPAANGLLTSGDSVSGTSTQPSVSFRLVDNLSGVIAEGKLTVVNGKFSGTFSFSTKATGGQVDIFNQAADGTESNNVAIPVRFGP